MKRLPILTKSFLGFSLFLTIALSIASFIFYYNLVRYTENEISKSSIVNLQTVERLNGQLVESITKQTIRLSLDLLLQEIFGIRHYNEIINDPGIMLKFMQVNQLLSETVNINYRIKSAYVYMDNADYVITSNQGVIKKSDFTDLDWITDYNKYKSDIGTIWLDSRPLIKGSTNIGNSVITCILPLRTMMINYEGAIVVNIYEHQLYSFMNVSNTGTDGYVFIINNSGAIISNANKTLLNKSIADKPYIKSILQSSEPTGYLIADTDAGKQMFTYYKSEFNNWIYLGVMPMNSLLGKTNALIAQILLVLAGLIIAGIIVSYFISKSMYNPVKKLMLDIQKRKGIDFKEAGNEMAVISKVFDSLARQEDALSNELEKNKRKLQDKYIIDLLEGNNEKLAAMDSNFSVEFENNNFLSIVIAIDRYDSFIEKHTPDQQYYFKMLILKTCEETMEHTFQVYGVLYEKNKIAVVLNSGDNNPETIIEKLRTSLSTLQKEVGKVMSNTITIGVGKCYEYISGLSASFSEAKDALANRIVMGSGNILFFHDYSDSESKYYYPYQIETHILNFLKLGSREELFSAIDELLPEIRSRNGITPDNIIQIFVQLIGNTVKFLVEMNINIGNIFGSDYNIYQKLATKETLDDIKIWLTGFYSGILQYMASSCDMGKTSVTDRVMDFLHKNYRANIDTTSIATNTGLGYSSIGRIVRNKTGKNVLEYINGLRIEEAKRLLRQTNMNVADIALNVGYNNDQSFSRFFKKFEGVTPGEFRNLQSLK
jgi:YesN/AraC family two-component response regulator